MLAADDFYDVLAAKERQLEDEWRAEHGVETEPTLTRTQELRERYLQKAVSVRTLRSRTSSTPTWFYLLACRGCRPCDELGTGTWHLGLHLRRAGHGCLPPRCLCSMAQLSPTAS